MDIHVAQVLIDGGIVNDLVGDPQPLTWIVLPCFIGHGHCALNPPAETEGFRQSNVQSSVAELIAIFTDGPDQAALIGLFQTSSNFFSASEATTVVAVGIV